MEANSIAPKLKWALGAVAVIALGAVALVYTASLAAIAVAGLATLVVVHGAPWAAQKIENYFLNLRKADARADPVTNRERISLQTWAKLELRKKDIEALDAEVRLWAKQIEELPPDEAHEFADELADARKCVDQQALAWGDAELAAKRFDEITAKVARKWKVAQTGMRIKQLSTKDKNDRINEILAAEAAESADRQLATAFSSLDRIIERGRLANLGLPKPAILDVQVIEVKQPVPKGN